MVIVTKLEQICPICLHVANMEWNRSKNTGVMTCKNEGCKAQVMLGIIPEQEV